MNIQMQKMETVITITDEEMAGTQHTPKENDSLIFCRICFDGMYLNNQSKKIIKSILQYNSGNNKSD